MSNGCVAESDSGVALPCISSYSRGRGTQTASLLPHSCTWSWGWTRSWWRFLWSTTHRCPTPRSLPPPHHTHCLEAQWRHTEQKNTLVIPDEIWVRREAQHDLGIYQTEMICDFLLIVSSVFCSCFDSRAAHPSLRARLGQNSSVVCMCVYVSASVCACESKRRGWHWERDH